MKKAVFTIASKNYLHFARTLMDSLRAVHPEWNQFVLLVDEIRNDFDPTKENFEVVEATILPLPDKKKFFFRYNILELNTAVKPWMLEWLFSEKGFDQVVYLDPDIFVYKKFAEVEEALDAGSLMVLTPHLTGQLNDDKKPSENEIVKAGSFNLGFIALAKHKNLLPFIHWWQSKLEYHCVVDIMNGLFVDQKWIDLVPGMFGDAFILRHEGYNVAYWNLKHRRLEKQGNDYMVNGQSLVFFHFSGLNPKSPETFSKHQDRYRLSDLGIAKDIILAYCNHVIKNGIDTCIKWKYAYDSFNDGHEIHDLMRRHYRANDKLRVSAGNDPFILNSGYFNSPWGTTPQGDPIITILMRCIWEIRPDVQNYFPDIAGRHRYNYAYWFVNTGAKEHRVPEYYVEPTRKSLHTGSTSVTGAVEKGIMKAAFHLNPLVKHIPAKIRDKVKARMFTDRPPITAQEIPHIEEMKYGVNYAGFYDQEGFATTPSSVWIGSAASVRIDLFEAGMLRIMGEYFADLLLKASHKNEMNVDVLMNGLSIGQFVLKGSGPFEHIISIPKIDDSISAILTLKPELVFVPSKLGMNNDSRELSFKVSKIYLNDTVIIDFSNSETPFMPGGEVARTVGINVIGYVRSEHGVGESARLCASALDASGIPFTMYDFNVGNSSRTEDNSWSHRISPELPHKVNLFHINADQMPVIHTYMHQSFDNHYNIGFWHWELPELPDRWLAAFNGLQEIWTPTQFVMDAVSTKAPIPVIKMGHGIRFGITPGVERKSFGLPEKTFLFLMMYDMHSYQGRKNPEAVIDAFLDAFPNQHDVMLVIKIHNTAAHPVETQELKMRLAERNGIMLINKMMSRQEVYDLEYLCDCFVSLHRSEGFGLGLAESMYLGKPVIGTYWSGNVDFMNYKNSCPVDYELIKLERDYGPYKKGQIWADPDVEHAAWYMQTLINDTEWRQQIAVEGQRTIRTNFSPEAIGALYRKRLNIISRW